MQDRYTGDIGDFAKLGLLRRLSADMGLRLGVNWYLYPDEDHNRDGRHIEYLDDAAFADCDPELWQRLRDIVRRGDRHCAALEQGLLPANTQFYRESLDFHDVAGGKARAAVRMRWHECALEAMQPVRMVFLDPDNGLATRSVKGGSLKAGKYVFWHELVDYASCMDVVILYQHFHRHGTHRQQMESLLMRLKGLEEEYQTTILRFRARSPRAFVIICRKGFYDRLQASIREFLASSWRKHWRLHTNSGRQDDKAASIIANHGGSPELARMANAPGSDDRREDCLCCAHGIPFDLPRICPLCRKQFKQHWLGIDAHWRAYHERETALSYETFFSSLCRRHRR